MSFFSLSEARALLATGQCSSLELANQAIARIEATQATLNAFISVSADLARASAQECDASRANGDRRPLLGVPIAVKDLFCTLGTLTSCGSKMLHNFVAPYDATAVAKLRAAGAVIIGKTNMDEFAMGSSTESSHYGVTKNPWDLTRVPGGSSGGSAVAVAANLVPLALGSDTGGSVRQPAAFCGVTGIKPTYGRVSRYGMIAYASSLDQAGVLARSAEDCAIMLQAIAGHDPRDATSAEAAVDDYASALDRPLDHAAQDHRALRIGLPREFYADLDADNARLLDDVRRQLEQQGVEFVDVQLPMTRNAIAIYYIIAPAECSANLSRFDGVRFGHRCQNPKDLTDLYRRSRSEGFGEEVQRRILVGTYVLSVGYHDAYYVQAQRLRRLLRDEYLEAFRSVDVLLTPATPDVAFPVGAIADPVSMYRQDIYTTPVNLAGLPAIAFPMGSKAGMPLGAQLIGPHFSEARLLQIVHRFQQLSDHHLQRAPFGAVA